MDTARHARTLLTAAWAVGLAAVLPACSATSSAPAEGTQSAAVTADATPGAVTACGVTDLPAGTKGLCVSTSSAKVLPDTAFDQLFEQADFDAKLGGFLEFETGTLADDGSLVVVAYPDDSQDETSRPNVGLLSAAGYAPFERDRSADSPTDVVGAARSGSTVAWLEQETSQGDADAGFAWRAWTGSGSTATQVADQEDLEPGGLSLDPAEPGPVFEGSAVVWRLKYPDGAIDPDSPTADAADDGWEASFDTASRQVSSRRVDTGAYSTDASGSHYTLQENAAHTDYDLVKTDADGTTTRLASGVKSPDHVLSAVRVVDESLVWLVTPDEAATIPDGAAMPDNFPQPPEPSATSSASPTASAGTTGGTVIYVYRVSAGQLLRAETTDPYLEPTAVAVSEDHVGWGGSDDPNQYVVDTATGEISTLGECPGCGLVALSEHGALLFARPDDSAGGQFVAQVVRLREK